MMIVAFGKQTARPLVGPEDSLCAGWPKASRPLAGRARRLRAKPYVEHCYPIIKIWAVKSAQSCAHEKWLRNWSAKSNSIESMLRAPLLS